MAFFPRLGPPLPNQFINHAHARNAVRDECFLGGTKGLGKGLEVKPLGIGGNVKFAARLDAELLTQFGGNDDAACRIDAYAGGLWWMVFWHSNGGKAPEVGNMARVPRC